MNRRSIALALALVPLLACSASSGPGSGSGGGRDGGGGGSGTHGAARQPSGPAPAQISGIFGYEHLQPGSGAAEDTASAILYKAPEPTLSSQYQDMFSAYAAVPLDTCTQLPTMQFSAGQPDTQDVGALSMVAPGGASYPLTEENIFGLVFYHAELAAGAFTPLGNYQLVAEGGVAPAFSGDFWTPSDLTLDKPVASGVLSVDRGKPLVLAWSGAPDGEAVMVQIAQLDTVVTCRLTDDGAFTIPASAFASFQASADVERPDGSDAVDLLTVERVAWYTVANGVAPVLVITTTGAKYEVDLK